VDNPPLYRALDVGAQAYAPSSLATGDGSATNAAIDAYTQDMSAKADPPKATHLPKSQIVRLSGLGTAAFAALEVVRAGGETSDIVTVVVRDRNVVVSVALQGVDHARGRTAYGPVSMSSLQAGATAAAHDVVSQLK
jgi:hypothetical protein